MNGRHRALVAGVHGLEHVEGFFAAALAQDNPFGTHTQRVLHQFALADFAFAFDVRRPCLHAPYMGLLQLEFGRVFDGDQTLLL